MIHLTNISFLNHGEILNITSLNILKKIARLAEWSKAWDLISHNLEVDCVGSNQLANICMSV